MNRDELTLSWVVRVWRADAASRPRLSREDRLRDLLIAAGFVITVSALGTSHGGEIWSAVRSNGHGFEAHGLDTASTFALAVLCGVALAVRRSHPRAALLWVWGSLAVAYVEHWPVGVPTVAALTIVVYAIARLTNRGLSLWAAATSALLPLLVFASGQWSNGFGSTEGNPKYYVSLPVIAAGLLLAWWVGDAARVRNDQQLAVDALTDRQRIAREMHDVVAHGLSVMIVQADGARYLAESEPQVAVDALTTISQSGRRSMTEMRRLLGLLREDSDVTLTAPQPGLAELPALIEDFAASGLPVELDLPQGVPHLPELTALTAYRLVQESLTNVVKHAGTAAHARVALATYADRLSLEVVDDGVGGPPSGDGLGLRGMKERVALVGGDVVAGPRPTGGWRVTALLPLALPGELAAKAS
ncbi:sensor histidine kinase [Luteipulveratus mongoliensis]|uniref:sensor histidine kinase n=1 Tax=Luteipulveratus mongoliensis TaxID=571913 RepID=UPI0006964C62|nr:sensor histidine kinase [Luteipulveratus mongoliensis]